LKLLKEEENENPKKNSLQKNQSSAVKVTKFEEKKIKISKNINHKLLKKRKKK
jgi:signal recognition particle subunit SEC65